MDDIRAVMDAAGSERAVLFGSGGRLRWPSLFAATYPERTAVPDSLRVLRSVWARTGRGRFRHDMSQLMQRSRKSSDVGARPTTATSCSRTTPRSKLGDEAFRRWYSMRLRLSASPADAAALHADERGRRRRAILPSIRVPTLILHRVGDQNVDVKNARYAAEHIPGARYLELPGVDHLPWIGDRAAITAAFSRVSRRGRGARRSAEAEPERMLATVLFTDIVGSTARAAELGDCALAARSRATPRG